MNAQAFPSRPVSFVRHMRVRLGAPIGVLLLLLLMQFVAVQGIVHLQQEESNQHFALQTSIDTLLHAMIDQQIELRDYIATTNPLFLAPFDQRRLQYLAALQQVSRVVQTKPFSATQCVLLQTQSQAENWYTTFALAQISAIQSGHLAFARSEPTLARGKLLFDRFRHAETHLQQTLNDEWPALDQQETLLKEGLLLALALCSLIAFAFLWFTCGRLARDLGAQLGLLQKTAHHFAEGELEMRINPLKHVELQQVGQALNTMAHTLLRQRQELVIRALVVERANEYWALINTVKTALLFISPAHVVLVVNQCFTDFFGLDASQLIGHPLDELATKWLPLFADSSSLQALFNGECTQQSTAILTVTHPQVRELGLQILPVCSQGEQRTLGCLYLLRDITQDRALERLKSEFISTVSHEFRTALTGIQGFSELIREEARENQEEIKEFASSINEDATRLTAIVSALLDFDQMQAALLQCGQILTGRRSYSDHQSSGREFRPYLYSGSWHWDSCRGPSPYL